MSRCFPYTPRGCKVSSGSNEALIESIKLQRKREQSEAERKKEKKRGKKEKRKEKKEKSNPNVPFFSHDDKIKKFEKSWAGPKDGSLQWGREEENEQLERSNLTEEHEQLIRPQNPSSSADSTQNSNKRKRHTLPPAIVKQEGPSAVVKQEARVSRGHGNVLRIRLSAKKPHVAETSVDREEPCSTSGRIDLPTQPNHRIVSSTVEEKHFPTPQVTNDVIGVLPCRPNGQQICSTSVKAEDNIEKDACPSWYKRPGKKSLKLESQYKDLIENWIPPPLKFELDFDDQDWLFTRKDSENQAEKKSKPSADISCCSSSSTMWPRAQFLPDADIYALPFTVPF